MFGDAGLVADDLLRAQRDARRALGRQRQRLVAAVGVQRLRAAEHRRHRLHRDADDVVVGLLRGQRAAGGLRVEAQLLRARIGRAEAIFHDPRPQPPRRAELRDLLEEVVVRVEEERQPLPERIDVEPGLARRLDIGDRVGERERDFLHRRRSRFADVIPADRDRVPLRHFALAEREDVRDDPQRGLRRIDVGAARDVFLQDVVLNRARQLLRRHALALADRDVQRQQDDRRRVDRHRRRHLVERDAVEQRRHVVDRIDRHADAPDFARRQVVIAVVADLRRQIERDAQAADALRQQVAIALVGFRRGAEAGVLPHRPQPAAIHRRLDAAGERKFAWKGKVALGIERDQIFGPVKGFTGSFDGARRNLASYWLSVCLVGFFYLGFFRRDPQRSQEAAIVDRHVERLARDQRLRRPARPWPWRPRLRSGAVRD